ncbi:MAG: 4Fe-4S binding protein [Thermodesulfobacteriota bacterium]
MPDIYQKLRERLDGMSTGFPATQAGTEIELLKQLFTETEAETYLALTPFQETPAEAARRLNRNEDELAARMEEMAAKGQLFRFRKKDAVKYAIVPFLVGIMEFSIKRFAGNRELAKTMIRYGKQGFLQSLQSTKTPHQRPIPVNRSLAAKWPVAPYEDVVEILKHQKRIALADCVCRTLARTVTDRSCTKPIQNCMMFGASADYYIENRLGREISVDEAIEITRQSDEAGLVLQPLNAQKAGALCSCCGDCCGMLQSLKMQPNPARAVQSNYYARVDAETCIGCELCIERCQMDAVKLVSEKAVIDPERCIGCGLCASKCPSGAMQLMKKTEEELYLPPETHMDMYIRMGRERGKL